MHAEPKDLVEEEQENQEEEHQIQHAAQVRIGPVVSNISFLKEITV
jgi:hypothetical protein